MLPLYRRSPSVQWRASGAASWADPPSLSPAEHVAAHEPTIPFSFSLGRPAAKSVGRLGGGGVVVVVLMGLEGDV